MPIHYFPDINRFRGDNGRFVSQSHAMLSSIARNEYKEAKELFERPESPDIYPSAPSYEPAEDFFPEAALPEDFGWIDVDLYSGEAEPVDHAPLDMELDGELWDYDDYIDEDLNDIDADDMYKED